MFAIIFFDVRHFECHAIFLLATAYIRQTKHLVDLANNHYLDGIQHERLLTRLSCIIAVLAIRYTLSLVYILSKKTLAFLKAAPLSLTNPC